VNVPEASPETTKADVNFSPDAVSVVEVGDKSDRVPEDPADIVVIYRVTC
jgi:hypothetical protein